MENSIKKCYNKAHANKKAVKYCLICNKHLCEICASSHFKCDREHELYSLDNDLNLNFTGTCNEKNHPNNLDYYCSTHNNLCCAACLCKIKEKGDGQHTECNVCYIGEIKDEKKKILSNNINKLKDLSQKVKKWLKEIKKIYEKTKPKKDEIKEMIVNTFDSLINILDKRKKELLKELDNLYEKLVFSEEFMKTYKKLPQKIDFNFKRGKIIIEKWEDDEKNGKLNKLINDCINIEKNIEKFQQINEKIKSLNTCINLQFCLEDTDLDTLSKKMKNLGKIVHNNYKFIFKQCPNNINKRKRFVISGEKGNIISKKEPNFVWTGTTCLSEFKNFVEYKWKIRILKSSAKQIMVGVVPIDFDAEKIDETDFTLNISGWFFYLYDLRLYSGPPHNYRNKGTEFNDFANEIILVMNMNKRSLKFILNNVDKGEQYKDIPIDKPLFPAVCLFNSDKVEILEI